MGVLGWECIIAMTQSNIPKTIIAYIQWNIGPNTIASWRQITILFEANVQICLLYETFVFRSTHLSRSSPIPKCKSSTHNIAMSV